jgi:hypothetical protein
MWSLLKRIKPNANEPWMVIGDFNETMWQSEHFSSAKRSESQMARFRNMLSFCNLHDLGFRGRPWTYDNKQQGGRNMFKFATVTHIVTSRSDHAPLLLCLGEQRPQCKNNNSFRYEHMWERDASLSAEIEKCWTSSPNGADLADVTNKLKSVQKGLKSWSRRFFGSVHRKVQKLGAQLDNLWNKPASPQRDDLINAKTRELDECLYREEMFWRQRSHVMWLREGEQNTKYFRRKATWRQKKNNSSKLKDDFGNWVDNPADLAAMTTNFFQEIV